MNYGGYGPPGYGGVGMPQPGYGPPQPAAAPYPSGAPAAAPYPSAAPGYGYPAAGAPVPAPTKPMSGRPAYSPALYQIMSSQASYFIPVPVQNPGWGAAVPPGVDPNVYQWFQAVDMDKSGRISVMELQTALTNANWSRFNTETCRLMIGMFDRDRSGQIDLNEFQALWTYIHQWKGIFDQFDRDRSGSIDAIELNNAYTQMGYRMTPQFAQSVVYRYDPVGRQRLTLDNFIQSCVLLKSVTDAFRLRDAAMRGVIQIGYEDFVSSVMLNKV